MRRAKARDSTCGSSTYDRCACARTELACRTRHRSRSGYTFVRSQYDQNAHAFVARHKSKLAYYKFKDDKLVHGKFKLKL